MMSEQYVQLWYCFCPLSANVDLRCFPIPVMLGTCFTEIKMFEELEIAQLVAFSFCCLVCEAKG